MFKTRRVFLLSAVLFVGCAAQQEAQRTPLLYPNKTLERKSHAQVQRDIEECNARADQFIKPLLSLIHI